MFNITQIALLAEHLRMSSEESQIVSEKNEAFWTEKKKKAPKKKVSAKKESKRYKIQKSKRRNE